MALLFADDLKLISKSETNDLTCLQSDLNNLHSWSVQNCCLFKYKKFSVVTFSLGRPYDQQDLMLGNNRIKHQNIARDLGLAVEEHLRWTEHFKTRIAKAMRSWYLIRRNTSPVITSHARIYLYRAKVCPILMFASECWDLKRSDYQIIENFNKKVLYWITGEQDYREAMIVSNLLSSLYLKVLKDLLLFSKIVTGHYDADFSEFLEVNWSAYRIKLPEIRYEAQRHNFWYRTGFRVNVLLQRNIKLFEIFNLKSNLITLMWDFFWRNWNSNNPCSWIYVYVQIVVPIQCHNLGSYSPSDVYITKP